MTVWALDDGSLLSHMLLLLLNIERVSRRRQSSSAQWQYQLQAENRFQADSLFTFAIWRFVLSADIMILPTASVSPSVLVRPSEVQRSKV